MKKNYIIPNQKVALMDAESVLAGSLKMMRRFSGKDDDAVEEVTEVWAKEDNSWDNEW